MFIDTHSHIYLENFDNDFDEMLQNAIENRVEKIILPNIDEKSYLKIIKLAKDYAGFLYPALGLHPTSVTKDYKMQLNSIFSAYSDEIVAIGEIGIDLYWDKSLQKEQTEAFVFQLDYAKENNKPVIIHSRESMKEILDIIKLYKIEEITGVFHCYSGTYEQSKIIIDRGFYLGIGGVITYKNSDLKEIVKKIPADFILLETDSPFLSPMPFRGKRNEPAYIKYIAEVVAEIKKITLEELIDTVWKNTLNCFKM